MMSCCRSQSLAVVSSSGLEMEMPGVVDDEVHAAEGERRGRERLGDLLLGR